MIGHFCGTIIVGSLTKNGSIDHQSKRDRKRWKLLSATLIEFTFDMKQILLSKKRHIHDLLRMVLGRSGVVRGRR